MIPTIQHVSCRQILTNNCSNYLLDDRLHVLSALKAILPIRCMNWTKNCAYKWVCANAPNESLWIIVMEKFTVIKLNATTCMIEHIENRCDVLDKYITSPSMIDLLHDLTELTIAWSWQITTIKHAYCAHTVQMTPMKCSCCVTYKST